MKKNAERETKLQKELDLELDRLQCTWENWEALTDLANECGLSLNYRAKKIPGWVKPGWHPDSLKMPRVSPVLVRRVHAKLKEIYVKGRDDLGHHLDDLQSQFELL